MRKPGFAMIGALAFGLVLFLGSPAIGGDYHFKDTLICTDCHVMHGQQQHGYGTGGDGQWTQIGSAKPYAYLLRNEPNALCLTCHDGSASIPDVLEVNSGAGVREAGALNRDGAAPYYMNYGHTLDSADAAPGGTWAPEAGSGLECVHCHGPHGSAGVTVTNPYRNLSPRAGTGSKFDPPSYAVGTNDLSKDVFERSAKAYDIADVDFNEPDQTKSAMATFCARCHSDFHGLVGGSQIGGSGTPPVDFVRHPSAGVNIGAASGGHSKKEVFAYGQTAAPSIKVNWVKVMTATEKWTPITTADVTDQTPTCITCHKAHGNKNPFGLVYMNPNAGAKSEEGTDGGTYRNLCNQCHSEGL